MSEINKKTRRNRLPLWVIPLPFIDLLLIIRYFIHGKNIALLNSHGFIAREQHKLIIFTAVVMLAVAIPALFIFYFVAWKYRESNTKVNHNPDHRHKRSLIFGIWAIPTAVMLILFSVMAPSTFRLVPQKTISADAKPLTIEVIALRWKWLFIYPDQGVAEAKYLLIHQ